MNKLRLLLRALLAFIALMCCVFFFWLGGGLHWLDKDVFPPQRPNFMPTNSVWIDAPPLPLSWHHGWWFGCSVSPSGATNYCRLVADGRTMYGGEYLSCRTHAPVPEQALKLLAPQRSEDMWLFGENTDGVVGFTKDDDILLPVTVITKCDAVRARRTGSP